MNDRYDVVVIGGGHAGCEAAAAAARAGARTALLTLQRDGIGAMSCNPAIGGLGKGHLVREIDALDGLMGRVADAAGIQFRMLNRRKGPAVRGPRTQADRKLYRQAMQAEVDGCAGLDVVEGEALDLEVVDGIVAAVLLAGGRRLACGAAVLTTGTFLRGLIHIGERRFPAGRMGEKASTGLSRTLIEHGLQLGRLKTGTPPRLDGRTIDWRALEMQSADENPTPFSLMTNRITTPQIECGITRTTAATHEVIRRNLGRSAMYSGSIEGIGPRYCPSIEDKIVRFGDREGHQIFLEPEGLDDDTVYPNGISTSLPEDAQLELLSTIPGLERAAGLQEQPGHAVAQIHEGRPQLERAPVLLDRPVERPGLRVGLRQLGVLVRQPRGDRRGQAVRGRCDAGRRPPEGVLRLGLPAHLLEHQPLVDERLQVAGVELQGPVELRQRPLAVAEQRQRDAEQVMDVGEGPSAGHDLLQQVDRAVVVLHREPLAGAGQHTLSLSGHRPHGTRRRNAGFPPETVSGARSRGPRPIW